MGLRRFEGWVSQFWGANRCSQERLFVCRSSQVAEQGFLDRFAFVLVRGTFRGRIADNIYYDIMPVQGGLSTGLLHTYAGFTHRHPQGGG